MIRPIARWRQLGLAFIPTIERGMLYAATPEFRLRNHHISFGCGPCQPSLLPVGLAGPLVGSDRGLCRRCHNTRPAIASIPSYVGLLGAGGAGTRLAPARFAMTLRCTLAIGLTLALGPGLALAQPAPTGRVSFVPFFGGMVVTDLAKIQGRLPAQTGGSLETPERIINLALTAQPAPAFGAALGVALSRHVELRATGAYARTEFDLEGIAAGSDRARLPINSTGGLAGLDWLSLHGDLLLRLAGRDRAVSPFVALGGGAVLYDMKDPADFFNLEPLTGIHLFPAVPRTSVTGAGVVGLGVDLRLGSHAALRFEASDAMSRAGVEISDLELSSRFVGLAEPDDFVHHVQARAGVSLRF